MYGMREQNDKINVSNEHDLLKLTIRYFFNHKRLELTK